MVVVERLQSEYPHVPTRLIVTGEPPCPNAKVYSLDLMVRAAAPDLLVMSDSEVRVNPDLLHTVAAEGTLVSVLRHALSIRPRKDLVTPRCTDLNIDFLGGIMVARILEGMKFAVGGQSPLGGVRWRPSVAFID